MVLPRLAIEESTCIKFQSRISKPAVSVRTYSMQLCSTFIQVFDARDYSAVKYFRDGPKRAAFLQQQHSCMRLEMYKTGK